MKACPGGATAGGGVADADAEAAAEVLEKVGRREVPIDRVPGVLERGHDRGHEVGNRADGAGHHEAERNQKPEKDPAAPLTGAAQRGALTSHLRLYNELG